MYLSITPVSPSLCLTLSIPYIFLHICAHITYSFSAPHPLSTLLPSHRVPPLCSSFSTPEHTLPSFSICLLNLPIHPSSFYPLPPHILRPLHPFHPGFITPFLFSLSNWNPIPLSSSDKPYNLIPTVHTLYARFLPLNLFLLSLTPCPMLNNNSSPIKMHYKANKTKTIQGSPIDFCTENSLLIKLRN